MTAAGERFSWFLQCPTTTTMARESFLIHRETWIRIRVWGNSEKSSWEREKSKWIYLKLGRLSRHIFEGQDIPHYMNIIKSKYKMAGECKMYLRNNDFL